jgi:hypothetical protein
VGKIILNLDNLAINLQIIFNMTKISFLIATFIFSINIATFAQVKTVNKDSAIDNVTIKKDERIDVITEKKIVIKKTTTSSTNTNPILTSTRKVKVDKVGRVNMPGFRIQIVSSTDRTMVYSVKAQLYQRFPTQKQYVVAQAPFFKLRFGNFTTRKEAEGYKKLLSSSFPNGLVIIPDIIETRVRIVETKREETPKESKK